MLEGLKEKATQPVGPLPAFAWVVVVVGGYFGYKFLKSRSSGGTTTTSSTATPVGASDTGTVGASSTDVNALTAQVSTLGNQITDLGAKISGNTGIGSTNASGTAYLTKIHSAINEATGKLVSLPANTNFNVVGQYTDASGVTRYLINYKGMTLSLQSGGDTVFKAATTATNTAAAAASTTATVASTAVASVGNPASPPSYGSNTAVTSSVGNPINVTKAATDLIPQIPVHPISLGLGMPTISHATVNAAAIQIPSVTSTPKRIVPKTITPPKPVQVVQASKQTVKAV
jgi:hypothetical protein